MRYLALIGDICDSRELSDRGAVQQRLQASLAQLNASYSRVLASPLTITLGDEFQALLTAADDIWPIVTAIESALYPTGIRFGIGVGELLTEVNTSAAIGMDGPAFYNAREAIQALKKSEDLYGVAGLEQDEKMANTVLALISDNRKKWSANRVRILSEVLRGVKVEAIAQDIGISKAAVYKNISDGSLKSVCGIFELIAAQLNRRLGV